MDYPPIAYRAWQELAEAYSEQVGTKPHNALYERPATLSLLPDVKGKRILEDAGCGPGDYADLLVSEGAEVVGFDRSPRMVELARARLGSRAAIIEADLREPLEFAEAGEFDIVLSSLALDYVPDWASVFQEFFRVLGPKGLVVLSAGHPFDDFWRFRGHANYFEIEPVRETWTGFGFEVEVPFYRRPLSEMVNPLIAAGFQLLEILEPRPPNEFKDFEPEEYKKLVKQPGIICLMGEKPAA